MTREQKAKAYDEALERAKSMIDDLRKGEDILAVSDLESMFPELKESEDERIGNVIYCIVRDNKEVKRILEGNGVSVDNALTYLEKQKINTEGDFGRGYDCGYKACLNSHGAEFFEKQKEQKPVEWSEEDEAMRDNILRVLSCFFDTSECDSNPSLSTLYPAYQKEMDWLKSLRFKPHWKPSEEQIAELNKVRTLNPGLDALYQQLKNM